MNISERIEEFKKDNFAQLEYVGISDSDFDCYSKMNENLVIRKLSILKEHLDGLIDPKELEQQKIMARHAASGKFGNDLLINLKGE